MYYLFSNATREAATFAYRFSATSRKKDSLLDPQYETHLGYRYGYLEQYGNSSGFP
jgi:hypothetical protein